MPIREIVGKTVGFGLVALALIVGGILDLLGGHEAEAHCLAGDLSDWHAASIPAHSVRLATGDGLPART